jgi:hypothetical protein
VQSPHKLVESRVAAPTVILALADLGQFRWRVWVGGYRNGFQPYVHCVENEGEESGCNLFRVRVSESFGKQFSRTHGKARVFARRMNLRLRMFCVVPTCGQWWSRWHFDLLFGQT